MPEVGHVSLGGMLQAAVPSIVGRLLTGLGPALQSGDESGMLHARRLTTALQASTTYLIIVPFPLFMCHHTG